MFWFPLEYPVSCVLFLVVLACIAQAWFFKKDFFNPPTIYCFSQCVTLGIAYLQYNKTMSDFQLKTWLFWIGAMISFCVGAYLARLTAKSVGEPVRIVEASIPENYNWKLHVALSFIPFALFLLGIYGIVQKAGNLLLFTDNMSQWMRKETDYGYYSVLFSSGPLCVLLFGAASFSKFNPLKSFRWLARFMVLLTIVLNLFAYPNRGTLFFSAGILIILFNYLRKRISAAWILVLLALAATGFIAISSLRDQYEGNSVKGMAFKAMIDLPYKYVSNNYWNFDYAINPPTDREYHPHTYGIDFFFGMFEFFQVPGSFRYSLGWDGLFNERIEKVHGLNTASYLWEVYKDLYAPGVFLFPFFVGLILALMHLRLCRKGFTPRVLLLYTMLIYIIGWWFFTPGYKQGIYWAWGIFVFCITTASMGKVRHVPSAPDLRALEAEPPVLQEIGCEDKGQQQVSA